MKKKILSFVLASSVVLGSMGVLPVSAAENNVAANATESLSATQVNKEYNVFRLLGIENEETLSITFNSDEMKLIAKGRDKFTHYGFGNDEYYRVEIKDGNGYLKFTQGVTGNGTTLDIAKNLNNMKLETGDIMRIYHKECTDRLRVSGNVLMAPIDFSNQLNPIKNSYNKIVQFQLSENGVLYAGEWR